MAEHRLNSRFRQDLRLLRPGALRQLSFLDLLWPALQFVIFGVLLPVAWLTQNLLGVAIGFAVISLWGLLVELVSAGRSRRRRLEHNERESDLLDLMARVPNGAPELAYIRHHCGCTYLHEWNGEVWLTKTRIAYAGPGDSCPAGELASAHDS